MIYVSVGENYCVQIGNWYRELPVLFGRLTSLSLEHSTVERNRVSIDVKQVAGTRDFPGRTGKCYFQGWLSFGSSTALKQDRQLLFVLRHQGWLPASPAALVEEVRQCVFVFTGMTGELDDDCLVFFHADGK